MTRAARDTRDTASGRSPRFRRWIGIDYSGAATPDTRVPGLQVAVVDAPGAEPRIVHPPHGRARTWTRRELHAWLEAALAAPGAVPTLVGIDHAFGYPADAARAAGATSWDGLLDVVADTWATDAEGATVRAARARGDVHVGGTLDFRLTDRWTAGAKGVFHFDVQGSVATSTHAGLPWLRRLRRRLPPPALHAWPFDGWDPPAGASVVSEVFPSLLRRRWPRPETRGVDAHDAWCVAAWLAAVDADGTLARYLDPPLADGNRATARLEGWILGVT